MTGDCGGKLECNGNGAAPPTSLFEITLGRGVDDKDFYDVSLVDGYNLPIVALPTGPVVGACNATGCVTDINMGCPKELQVMGEEEERGVVACKSACEAFGLDQYCCSGQFANPTTCRPSLYSTIFKRACPRAYSYAFDDGTSTFTCKASEYAIIFCPGRVKRPSNQNLQPPSPPQNQFGQPLAPPTPNQYGQPTAPPTQNQYGQPMAPPTPNQYGQPTAPLTQNPYGQPMTPPNQNQPVPNQNQYGEPMTSPPQVQSGNGQFMAPPTLNQDPNIEPMNPPGQPVGLGRVSETQSSSENILRPFPVFLLLGLGLELLLRQ